ncbi:MAG: 4Fe-4S binding protein [Desulfobacterales bacterium]
MPELEADQAYRKLCDIIMMPKNKLSIEILKILYPEKDAKMLAAGPFNIVQADRYTIEEFAEKTGYPVDEVKETFERLAKRGVLFWVRDRRDNNKKKYTIPPLFPGIVEYFIVSPHNSIDERRAFVKKMHQREGGGITTGTMDSDFSIFRIIPSMKPDPESRVVEIGEHLESDKSQVFAYQDVVEIINEAGRFENNIAVMPCTCRLMAMMTKESPECNATVENCMAFGAAAHYVVEEGIGRNVDVDESLDILKQAEKDGLIHLSTNTVNKHGFICNCCSCCCGIIGSSVKMNRLDIFEKSDYVPVIDADECTKCKKCITICSFHALLYKMGEKDDKSEDRIIVREDACIGCGVCASNCPSGAIRLKKVRESEPAGSFQEGIQRMFAGTKS